MLMYPPKFPPLFVFLYPLIYFNGLHTAAGETSKKRDLDRSLFDAVKQRDPLVLKKLLADEKSDVNARNELNTMSLMDFAVSLPVIDEQEFFSKVDILELLAKKGADVNTVGSNWRKPCDWAFAFRDVASLGILLDHGGKFSENWLTGSVGGSPHPKIQQDNLQINLFLMDYYGSEKFWEIIRDAHTDEPVSVLKSKKQSFCELEQSFHELENKRKRWVGRKRA